MRLLLLLPLLAALVLPSCGADAPATVPEPEARFPRLPTPVLTRNEEAFLLDGEPLSPFGLRAVNALQSDAIAERLAAQLSGLRAHGVQSVVLGLQGGRHTEDGNSAFNGFGADGRLLPDHAERLARLLDATAERGVVPVVNLFYRGREQELSDEEALREAVRQVVRFIRPWRHAWVQVINEPGHGGFRHDLLTSPEGQAALHREAKRIDPDRIVYVSHEPGAHDGFLADTWGRLSEVTPPGRGHVSIEYVRGDRYDAPGVFSAEYRHEVLQHAALSAAQGGYWFWHAAWHQKADRESWPRFDPGGAGTEEDPGTAFAWEAMRRLAAGR